MHQISQDNFLRLLFFIHPGTYTVTLTNSEGSAHSSVDLFVVEGKPALDFSNAAAKIV